MLKRKCTRCCERKRVTHKTIRPRAWLPRFVTGTFHALPLALFTLFSLCTLFALFALLFASYSNESHIFAHSERELRTHLNTLARASKRAIVTTAVAG